MPNINDAFPSKYLRAHDLGDKQPVVVINRAAFEQIGDDRKLVVYFDGKEKGLCLNKTNANAIADLLNSQDTDDWKGHRIKLVVAKVDYQGKRVPAIRVEPAPRNGNGARPAPPPPPVDDEPLRDEDIPFAWLLPLAMSALAMWGLA